MKFITNINNKFAPVVLMFAMLFGLNFAAPITALACSGGSTEAQKQVLQGVGETGGACNDNGVINTISAAVKILSIFTGAAAVIMIIYGGFRYITSGGDSARVSSAKNTLIYAVIGLAIAVLAQLIVNFVITQSSHVACPANQHLDSASNKCVKN